ncbi:MAG: glycosyltransferase [Kiritimatiellae bacterium]|nr:glycosyltransferase [Kiritimatiellia bacterium]MDW8457736.1 glycosyltransferase [Verrucomicrobiota bacterium]
MDERGRYTILHLCEHFGGREATLHGVARAFQWWIPNFDSTRFRVLLCSRKGWDRAAEQMVAAGIHPRVLGHGRLDPRNLTALLRLIREERVDLLHCHGYGACTWGRIAGRLLGLPVIVHERCNYGRVPVYQRPVEWLLAPWTDYAFAVSESTRRFCIEKRYLKAEIVETLYNGILMDDLPPTTPEWRAALRAEFGTSPSDPLLGIVGRIESHKGHLDALQALETVLASHPAVKCWIVGDGAFEAEVRRRVAERGLERAVRFLGFRRDVRQVIQCFDVQVFPSHREGTPNTLYEAMLAGVPAVASTADGQGEILEHEKTALLFAPGDSAMMARHIIRLLEDPALRARLGEAARERIREFDGLRTIRRMEAVYLELLEGRESRGRGAAEEHSP